MKILIVTLIIFAAALIAAAEKISTLEQLVRDTETGRDLFLSLAIHAKLHPELTDDDMLLYINNLAKKVKRPC